MICTFYSFKGGVGRSMALANVAELLYNLGLKVLMVDFDLEAPGLERYFNVQNTVHTTDEVLASRGLIDMLLSYKDLRSLLHLNLKQPDTPEISQNDFVFPFPVEPLTNFIIPIYKENSKGGVLSLIPAGRRSRDEFTYYAQQVRSFDWNDFYLNWDGELYFEWFRQEAESNAEVVLLDSRTGVTEMSGVCAYQLADIVVMFVSPNQQNLSGTLMMAKSLSKPALVQEGRKGRALSLLFVPSRVEQAEKSLLDNYEEQFDSLLGGFVSSGLKFEKNLFTDLKIPYIPYYAYEENVAVREAEKSSASDLVKAFERLVSTLGQLAPSTHPLFQLFQVEQNKPITVDIPPVFNYSSAITDSTHDFTGREWLFQILNAWMADFTGSRFFVLIGDPGSGKTAVASRLVQFSREGAPAPTDLGMLNAGFLGAVHFCSVQDKRTVTPHTFLESLSVQLAVRYPAYIQAIIEKGSDRQVRIVVEQRVHEGSQIVVVKNLSVGEGPTENAFNRLIREPLGTLLQKSTTQQVFILIDGLDEAFAYSGEQNILSLLSQAEYLPPGVRFIVTTRPHIDVLRLLQRSGGSQYSLTSGEGLQHSLDDVRRYVLEVMRKKPALSSRLAPAFTPTTLATAVQAKSGGNLLYVNLLLSTLEAQPQIRQDSLDLLPEGMDNIYIDFLERLGGDEPSTWEDKYGPVLGTLAVAAEPLTEEQLADLVGVKKTDMRQILKSLRQFLSVDDSLSVRERTYSIFHHTFASFLQDEDRAEEYWCDAGEYHRRFVEWCEKGGLPLIWIDISRDPAGQERREYARRHYITHLYRAQAWQRLFEVLDAAEYGRAKIRHDPHTHSYTKDLDLGRQAAAREEWTMDEGVALLAQLWRYTLLRCSLTPQRYVHKVSNISIKINMLLQIAKRMRQQPDRKQEYLRVFMIFWEVARAVMAFDERSEITREVGRALIFAQLWERAEAVANSLEDPEIRTRLLGELACELAKARQWEWAEVIARTIPVGSLRTNILRELGGSLARANHWERAEAVANSLEDPVTRTQLLGELACELAKARQWKQAEATAHSIKSPWMRARVLGELGCELAKAQQWEQAEIVWAEMEQIANSSKRSRMSTQVASSSIKVSESRKLLTERSIGEQAESVARSIRVSGLEIEISEEQDKLQTEILTCTIKTDRTEAKVLEELGNSLVKAQQWERSEMVAHSIQDFEAQAKVLIELTRELAEVQEWERAETIVGSIQDFKARAEAMRALARGLAKTGNWEQAEGVARSIGVSETRAEALSELTREYAKVQQWGWGRAEAIARSIEVSHTRAEALSELVHELAKVQQWERAEEIALSIEDPWTRSFALGELGKELTKGQRVAHAKSVWAEMKTAAHSITDSRLRAESLQALAIALESAGEQEEILHLVQRMWLEAETREYAIELLPLAIGLIPLKLELGVAFYESFAWVDKFLQG